MARSGVARVAVVAAAAALLFEVLLCDIRCQAAATLPELTCSVKRPDGGVREHVCIFTFSTSESDCRRNLSNLQQQQQQQRQQQQQQQQEGRKEQELPPLSSSFPSLSPSSFPSSSFHPSPSPLSFPSSLPSPPPITPRVTMMERPLNSANSLVDLTFTLQEDGLTLLMISGEAMTTEKNRRGIHLNPGRTLWKVNNQRTTKHTKRQKEKSHRNGSTNNSWRRRYSSSSRRRLGKRRRRCVVVGVRDGSAGEEVVVKNLPLPHGQYNVTVHLTRDRSSPSESHSSHYSSFPLHSSSSSSSLPSFVSPSSLSSPTSTPSSPLSSPTESPPASSPLVLSHHHNVTLPFNQSGIRYEWDQALSRGRRVVGDTASFVLRDLGGDISSANINDNNKCDYQCYSLSMGYDPSTAILQLDYSVNASCHNDCLSVTVQLYEHKEMLSQEECESHEMKSIMEVQPVGMDRNVTEGPVPYPNVDKGCYMFELKSQVSNWPERMGLLWLLPNTNTTIVDMKSWNTTFYLEPNPEKHSLWVGWKRTPPYNFATYEVQLWHSLNHTLCCQAKKDGPVLPVTVIPRDAKLIINESSYKFYNLSVGWYCVRVTPLDNRCPRDGCEPRSSPAKLLEAASHHPCPQRGNCNTWPTAALVVAVVAGVAAVVGVGVALACCVIRWRPTLGGVYSVAYARVPVKSMRKVLTRQQKVLVVWTPCGQHGDCFGPVVAAFKRVLQSYAHCQVYDYLDLLSLPDHERRHLLAYPIAWLDSLLLRPDIKVIIVATAGARQRQAESYLPTAPSVTVSTKPSQHSSSPTSNVPPLDPILFPYLLRRLQDTPDLAMDYSRVFHVRFSDISDSGAELEGIVSWTRYRLPQHFPALAYSLHGSRYLGGMGKFEDPSPEILRELHKALTNHPNYQPQPHTNTTTTTTSPSSPSPDILTSSRPAGQVNGVNGTKDSTVTSVQNGTLHPQRSEPDSPA